MSKRKLPNEKNSDEKKAKTTHWSLGLLETIKDPKNLIQEDSYTYVIADKFPKAKYHYLVISKQEISSISKVTINNLDLLRHMEKVAKKIVQDVQSKEEEKYNFKIGYHAQPSMARLHLHVISDDMNSACLKTKKHWNSFTTNFFIPSENIIESLEKNKTIQLPSDQQCKNLLMKDLICNKCIYVPKHLGDLKKHILEHLKK
ncbi:aprataxin [Coccinella septempunctata]|uniref:aprataxin n=1 Tax=Coccinella septempunctata TaxID=41139 RepID=UPI001D07F69C|nr:aprataxin [Coccinella septempunctata]